MTNVWVFDPKPGHCEGCETEKAKGYLDICQVDGWWSLLLCVDCAYDIGNRISARGNANAVFSLGTVRRASYAPPRLFIRLSPDKQEPPNRDGSEGSTDLQPSEQGEDGRYEQSA